MMMKPVYNIYRYLKKGARIEPELVIHVQLLLPFLLWIDKQVFLWAGVGRPVFFSVRCLLSSWFVQVGLCRLFSLSGHPADVSRTWVQSWMRFHWRVIFQIVFCMSLLLHLLPLFYLTAPLLHHFSSNWFFLKYFLFYLLSKL